MPRLDREMEAALGAKAASSLLLIPLSSATRRHDQPHNPISVKVDAEEHLLLSTSGSASSPFPLPPTVAPSTLGLPLSDPHVFAGSPLTPVQLDDLLVKVNALAQLFKRAPDGAIPPPPQALDRQRQAQVVKFKEEGNVSSIAARCALQTRSPATILLSFQNLFKAKQYQGSVQFYSLALKVAVERMPWEAAGFQREELSVILCNRAAAYGAIGEVRPLTVRMLPAPANELAVHACVRPQWERSLLDSKAVIAYKRPWSKGHFRAAKSILPTIGNVSSS